MLAKRSPNVYTMHAFSDRRDDISGHLGPIVGLQWSGIHLSDAKVFR